LKTLAGAWKQLTWRHWAWMLAIALAMDVTNSVHITESPHWMGWRMLYHAPWWIAFGTVFLLAVVFVESSASPSMASMLRYFGGALAASCACLALTFPFEPLYKRAPTEVRAGKLQPPPPAHLRPLLRRSSLTVNFGLEACFRGVFVTLIYAAWRRSRHAERLLADAELVRARARRELLASQLDASRQAIDPDGVLKKLELIEGMYAEDPIAAEALMDRLIEALREAIPKVRADLGVEAHAT
jgi:hypothetical protein